MQHQGLLQKQVIENRVFLHLLQEPNLSNLFRKPKQVNCAEALRKKNDKKLVKVHDFNVAVFVGIEIKI